MRRGTGCYPRWVSRSVRKFPRRLVPLSRAAASNLTPRKPWLKWDLPSSRPLEPRGRKWWRPPKKWYQAQTHRSRAHKSLQTTLRRGVASSMPLDDLTKYLVDPASLEALPAQFENLAVTDDAALAGELVAQFDGFIKSHPGFSGEFPDVSAIYHRYITQAKFIGLALAPARDIRSLFSQQLSAAFAIPEYDIVAKVKERLRAEPYEDRDELRKIMREALIEGTSELTRMKITTNAGDLPGTVGNWIKDYLREAGTEQREAMKRAQYLSGGANLKRLAPEERERVKKFIELFEYLTLSSISAEGFEDDSYADTDRGIQYYQGGNLVEIGEDIVKRAKEIVAARSTVSPEDLLALYKGSAEEQEAVRNAGEEIQKKSKDPKAWEKMLVDAVAPSSPTGKVAEIPRVVALLRLLVLSGQFDKAIRTNTSL